MNIKTLKICLISVLIFTSLIPIITNNSVAESREIYVKESYFGSSDGSAEKPYKTIQEAIDAAEEGDTIYIFGGFYQENLEIDKQLKIVGGIDEVETIIDSRFDRRYLVEITADEVTLEYVTVSDSDKKTSSPIGALICLKSDDNKINNVFVNDTESYGILIQSSSSDNLVSSNKINMADSGIYVTSSDTNDIVNNEISNCSSYGIYVEYSTGNNRIYGNNVTLSGSGIYVKNSVNVNITNNIVEQESFHSLYISGCSNSQIINNKIGDSSSNGIYLKSSSCIVRNNTLCNNSRGVYIDGNYNDIYYNEFIEQKASGIYVKPGAIQNKIFENDFLDNGKSAQDNGDNQWYYESKGNYWSDYDNTDKDLDGIGDQPYSKNGVLDLYPLGYFLKPPKQPTNPSPGDTDTGVGLSITLSVKVEDPDSDELTVYFYNGDDDTLIETELTSENPVRYVESGSRAEVKFTLGFDRVFSWYAVVYDGLQQNTSAPFIFSTQKTPPDNEPPVADADGPYFTEMNQQVQFDSSGSYDPDGTIAFYRWNFGDGSSEILEENPTHIYESAGEFQASLTIIDNDGSSSSSNTFVSVGTEENDPPVAKITLTSSAEVEQKILFDGSQSYDPDNDELDYLWDFGNGASSVSESPSYSYKNTGTYFVKLTVSDDEYSDTTTTSIKIKDKPGIPGFEMLFLISAVIIIFVINKKIRN
jgi:parallel beta-helix repeat protein